MLARLLPYLAVFLTVLFFIASIFIFSYVLIFAVVVGLVLSLIGFFRVKFFGYRAQSHNKNSKSSGRIIEHDDSEKNK